jgi:hypothetical protein
VRSWSVAADRQFTDAARVPAKACLAMPTITADSLFTIQMMIGTIAPPSGMI